MHDSGLGRLIGVLVSPTKTFESIREKPSWIAPLLVLIFLGVFASYLATQKMDFGEIMRQSAKDRGQEMTEEQAAQAEEMVERFGKVGAVVAPLIISPVVYLLVALIFWGAFRFFGSSELSYKGSLATTLHGLMPWGVHALLSIPVILGRETIDYAATKRGFVASNLAALAGEDTKGAVLSLMSSLDFFSLWTLVLFIVGYRTVARVSTATAATTVIVPWLLYVGVKAGWAALFG